MDRVTTVEIGSTITKVNGFRLDDGVFHHVAQGFAETTVDAGDVAVGARQALRQAFGSPDRPAGEVFVNSSAAGGLRMSVHGLTSSMTARAAREAALGAGAIIVATTVGPMDEFDAAELRRARPGIVLLAGGVDGGERRTVVDNAEVIASARLGVPVVYAGNAAARGRVEAVLAAHDQPVVCVDNVFPDVDVLRVEPVRRLIHEVFNDHITQAPGMAGLARLSDHEVLPTPGAVLRATELFAEALGDALVVDVGGATTDVHSVTEGSAEWTARSVEPEPRAKRTVEGDLGVFVNAARVAQMSGERPDSPRLAHLRAIPGDERQAEVTRWLAGRAVEVGVARHAGRVTTVFTPTGTTAVVRGKDLTAVRWVVGTGGALTRIDGGAEILASVCTGAGDHLMPGPEARVLIDRDYRFSALGTLAGARPEAVRRTFAHWVEGAGALR